MLSIRYVLVLGLALIATSARAQSPAPLDGDGLQKVTLNAAASASPDVKAAVDVLVKAGWIKGPLFDALKPSLVAAGATVGAVDQAVATQKATDFAQKKYGASTKFDHVTTKDGLFVVFLKRVGSGDLNPTLTIGVVVDEHGQIVKDIAAQGADQVMRFLFPGPPAFN